jgi:hypothetical protein
MDTDTKEQAFAVEGYGFIQPQGGGGRDGLPFY